MITLYTPNEWRSIFPNPTLVIDGEYIYTDHEYQKIRIGSVLGAKPCARIDDGKGVIYGFKPGAGFVNPIAEIKQSDGETRFYKYPYNYLFSKPFLYIKGNAVYTPEEYHKVFPNNPVGYVKDDRSYGDSSGEGGGIYQGIVSIVGGIALLAAMVGLVFALVSGAATHVFTVATTFPFILVMIAMVIVLSLKLRKTTKPVNVFEDFKRQCSRSAVAVTLKAMIVPLAAALLGMALTGVPAMFMVCIPMMAFLFAYCWAVVRRQMMVGMLDPNGKANGSGTQKSYGAGAKKSAGGIKKPFGKAQPSSGSGQNVNGDFKDGDSIFSSFGGQYSSGVNQARKPGSGKAKQAQASGAKAVRACPNCGTQCRVPAGRGSITITCPKCYAKFNAVT